MTRIIAGSYKGRELRVPPRGTRPTSSRVREALFSRIENWNLLAESRVLDLCAGSGALGLEAASRGARQVDLVEMSTKAARICQQNAALLSAQQVRVHAVSAKSFLSGAPHSCDLVFLDPPYDMSAKEISELANMVANGWLEPHGVLVVERSTRSEIPEWGSNLALLDGKKYGETMVWFLELSNSLE